jgi:hypothetical protein
MTTAILFAGIFDFSLNEFLFVMFLMLLGILHGVAQAARQTTTIVKKVLDSDVAKEALFRR